MFLVRRMHPQQLFLECSKFKGTAVRSFPNNGTGVTTDTMIILRCAVNK